MNKLKCLWCGHRWIPRVSKPVACPKCHSIKWDKEAKQTDDKLSLEVGSRIAREKSIMLEDRYLYVINVENVLHTTAKRLDCYMK